MPLPRIGDQVTFEVLREWGGQSHTQNVSYSLVEMTELALPDGQKRMAVGVREEIADGPFRQVFWLYVDLESNRLLKYTDECAVAEASVACSPLIHTYSGRGLPWGFGSALLQGHTLVPGESKMVAESLDDRRLELELRVSRAAGRGAVDVQVHPMNSAATPAATGYRANLTVQADNPYVQRAEYFSFGLNPASEEPQRFSSRATQVHFSPGDGPPIAQSGPAPAWRACAHPGSIPDGPLPPGSDYVFPELGLSLQEFAAQLEAKSEAFAGHIRRGGQVETLRLMNGLTESDLIGLTDQRTDRAVVVFPYREGSSMSITMGKRTQTQLVPPGEEVSYWIDEQSEQATFVPPMGHRPPLVTVRDVAERHAEAGLEGAEDPLGAARFELTPRLNVDGGLHYLRHTLEFRYPGEPFTPAVMKYDLTNGCLIEHQPGRRLPPP